MGIYTVKSCTCDCKGTICTLTADHRVYMDKPCVNHKLEMGNSIYYELNHLFKYLTKYSDTFTLCHFTNTTCYEPKYLIKVLDIKVLDKNKKLVKAELIHNGTIDVSNFNKNIIYSEWNDETSWKKIDENTIHFIFLYQDCHHTVEKEWKPFDY